ncbi:MAG: tetratricopeptide repeat protein [Elusimicrobiota bacterium]
MAKHWSRQDLKKDDLETVVAAALGWIAANRQKAAAIAGGIVIAAAIGAFAVYGARAKTVAAWNDLAIARALAYSGRAPNALQEIQRLEADYPQSDAAAYANLFAGDVLYQGGRYQDALANYQKVLSQGRPLVIQPFALDDAALAEESLGDCKDSAVMSRRFLDAYPENFLAPQAHLSLARCLEALGQIDEARAAYQKIALQYPGTSFAQIAQEKAK